MLAATVVLNTVIAVAITVFGSDRHGHGFAVNFVFSQSIGLVTYALIDLPSFHLKGRYSLFAAHRLADRKNGQLVTFEQADDAAKFSRLFVPD